MSTDDMTHHHQDERSQPHDSFVTPPLQDIFQRASVGIALLDTDGRFLVANPALSTLLGYTPEDLVSLHLSDVMHPDDVGLGTELYGSLVAGYRSYFQLEQRCLTQSNATGWVRLTVLDVGSNRPDSRLTVALFEDITERKHVEMALVDRQQNGRVFQEALGIGGHEVRLTDRDLAMLRLIGAGKTNQEIAWKLRISTKSVEKTLSKLFAKLGVSSRGEAAVWAVRAGLI